MSKERILRLCEDSPREIFYILSKNGFENAKAFWGKGTYKENGLTYQYWTKYLQELALTPDNERIDYLYKFI